MPSLDMVYRFMATDAGAAAAFTGMSEKARVAAVATQDLTAAQLRSVDAQKLAADASVRAADLRLRASTAMVEAQRLETEGDRASAIAARESANALRAQATAAGVTSRELNAMAVASARQAEVVRASRAVTAEAGLTSRSVHGLIGEATGLTSAMESIPTPVTVAAGALGKLGVAAGAAGLGLAALSIDEAQKFQTAMTRLHTQANVSNRDVGVLSKGILNLAGSVATTPKTLADAAYHIASVGQHSLTTAQQLAVLKVASEGAKLGGADLVDVTNTLDAALVAHVSGVHNYSQAMGVLNATVGAGDMSMQDLADAFGPLGSTFKGFGVSIQQAGAALATFGDNNIRGALAGSQLRMSVTALAHPLSFGVTQLQEWGLKSGNLTQQLRQGGLTAALDVLAQKLHDAGYTAKTMGPILAEMFGKRGPQQGLSTLINELDRYHSKLDEVTHGGNAFASSWAGYTKTFSYNLDAAKAAAEALAIKLGDKLLPTATRALHWLGTTGIADLQKFGDWFQAHQKQFEEWAHFAELAFKNVAASFATTARMIQITLDLLEGHWGNAWKTLEKEAKADFTNVANNVKAISGVIVRVVSSLAGDVEHLASRAWHGFESEARKGISGTTSVVRALPGHIIAALSALPADVAHLAASAWQRFLSAARHGGQQATAYAARIPSMIVAAVGDLGSLLVHAGEAAIGGLVSGMLSAAESKLKGALHYITHLIPLHKGPIEVDRMLLYASGQAIMDGLVGGIGSRVSHLTETLRAVTDAARRTVWDEIAGSVAPVVTDPRALVATLGHDTQTAISRQQSANIGAAHYTEMQEHADELKAALHRLRVEHQRGIDAATAHATRLSNLAHAAHEAAANLSGTGKAAAAAKHAAEVHARALDDEARAARQAATAIRRADAEKEKSALHAADVATKAAEKAKAAYDKEKAAAQAAAQAAEQAAQNLVQALQTQADAWQTTVTDFENTLAQGLTGDYSLATIWGQLTDAQSTAATNLASAQQALADAQNQITSSGTAATQDQLAAVTAAQDALTLAQQASEAANAAVSPAGLQSSLNAILASTAQFAGDLKSLIGEGASQTLISQLVGMGPAAGDALAQQLLQAGSGSVKQLSSTLDQIAQYANQAADAMAKSFYGGGVSAMEQFVEGLMTAYPDLRAALAPLLAELEGLFGSGAATPAHGAGGAHTSGTPAHGAAGKTGYSPFTAARGQSTTTIVVQVGAAQIATVVLDEANRVVKSTGAPVLVKGSVAV